jgi:hypothetical protein
VSGRQQNRRAAVDGKPSAKATLVKRFKDGERQAEDTLTRWIGHPALQPVVERRRLGAEAVVLPISRLLTGQGEVVRFCWHIYGMAGIDPDWNLRRGEPWMLTIFEMSAIERVKADFRGVVQLAVNELAGAGVGLMPNWDPDHAVIGELLLLPGFPWELSARERAQHLNPPPVAAIDIDASGTSVRRGIAERAESNITSIRRTYERHLHGSPPRAPYAAGGARSLPEPTRRRREALQQVLQRWPDATASGIWTSFGDHGLMPGQQPRTPGGYLRRLLEEGADDGQLVVRPSKSTIHEDLKALRATGADQKRSG